MKHKQVAGIIIAGLSLLLLLATAGLAQPQKQGAPAAPKPTFTMTGKIINSTSYGGFIVIRMKPHEEYKIVNENEKILRQYANKGEPVQIEGWLRGAYFLTITKINGQDYPGPQ